MRTVKETSTYLTLQSKCLFIVDVLVMILGHVCRSRGAIVLRGYPNYLDFLLSYLLLLSGTLTVFGVVIGYYLRQQGSIIGTIGCLAKPGERYPANIVVRFCTRLLNGDAILAAGILLLQISITTCAFSIYTFQSPTTWTFQTLPDLYALLVSAIALSSLSVIVASTFSKSVSDHQRTIGTSIPQYHHTVHWSY